MSRNGYPRGIISYNMNSVVNKNRNKRYHYSAQKRIFYCFTPSMYIYCHYLPYLVLVLVLKCYCSLDNRYFWRCMLEHMKREVHKWKFLQHALSRHVYKCTLLVTVTQVKMAKEYDCLRSETYFGYLGDWLSVLNKQEFA